ncbi:MAG: VOC family protein [Acidobacteria bacterium]|jgi:PhnB protein|nr:VOC family protein [Acidobacteriota bacterium]
MSHTNSLTRRRFVAAAASAAALVAAPSNSKAGQTMRTYDTERTTLTPYLLFDGNCLQAMEFYRSCLGGELKVLKVKDSPMKDHMPAAHQEKILNANLRSGLLEISASDWLRPDRTMARGNMTCLYLSGGTLEALTAVFHKLSDGGEVTDPLQQQFFGAYGAINDRFGVRWMFVTGK